MGKMKDIAIDLANERNNKTEYYTYDSPFFSEEDITIFSMEIIKNRRGYDGKMITATIFVLRLKEKLEKVAQERAINQNKEDER